MPWVQVSPPLTKRRTPLLRCSSFGRGRRTICNCPSETLSHSFPWSGCCALCFFPSLASLHLPPGAVGSSPRHASCRSFKPFSAPAKKKKHRFLGAFFLAGAEGQHNRPLAVPKICFGLERRQILTAAPSSPRFICHRQRIGDDARHASCLGFKFLRP